MNKKRRSKDPLGDDWTDYLEAIEAYQCLFCRRPFDRALPGWAQWVVCTECAKKVIRVSDAVVRQRRKQNGWVYDDSWEAATLLRLVQVTMTAQERNALRTVRSLSSWQLRKVMPALLRTLARNLIEVSQALRHYRQCDRVERKADTPATLSNEAEKHEPYGVGTTQ